MPYSIYDEMCLWIYFECQRIIKYAKNIDFCSRVITIFSIVCLYLIFDVVGIFTRQIMTFKSVTVPHCGFSNFPIEYLLVSTFYKPARFDCEWLR